MKALHSGEISSQVSNELQWLVGGDAKDATSEYLKYGGEYQQQIQDRVNAYVVLGIRAAFHGGISAEELNSVIDKVLINPPENHGSYRTQPAYLIRRGVLYGLGGIVGGVEWEKQKYPDVFTNKKSIFYGKEIFITEVIPPLYAKLELYVSRDFYEEGNPSRVTARANALANALDYNFITRDECLSEMKKLVTENPEMAENIWDKAAGQDQTKGHPLRALFRYECQKVRLEAVRKSVISTAVAAKKLGVLPVDGFKEVIAALGRRNVRVGGKGTERDLDAH
jgi:hypothetical protein